MALAERTNAKRRRRVAVVVVAVLVAAIVVVALSRLDLSRVGPEVVTASPGWLVLAVALMATSLVLRSLSWHEVLRAALPGTHIGWWAVTRATMIGVMGSAVFPGRLGEPSRVLVVSRHLDGSRRRLLPLLAGTVFSQTLINLLALGVLAIVTFSAVPLGNGHATGIVVALAIPLAIAALVVAGPRLLAIGRRSRSPRLRAVARSVERLLLHAREGLAVFARPRYAVTAVTVQLLAWALQWMACYVVLLSLGLQHETDFATAAAVLLAVNVSAILPATPSNVGVFQAACLVVLAAYGVGGGPGLAYGILLQAVEVVTALALGVPALLREGLTWGDLRRRAEEAEEEEMRSVAEASAREGAPASAREGAE